MMKRFLIVLSLLALPQTVHAAPLELLNVSYDPTREFYDEYNALFIKDWKNKTGQDITIAQSHGGSGKQARSVIDGLKADVVTLALAYDIDVIADKSGLLPADWQSALPHNSTPLTSTIVFLVRKGNPKHIKDWGDLVKQDIQVITPNPKTSGGARWNYLAAWAYAEKLFADEAKTKNFIQSLFKNVPVLDAGARGATTTFVQRGIGDVLLAWENEALLARQKMGAGQFEIVYPSISILAEPPVALVEKNAAAKGTSKAAKAYLEFMYSPGAQALGAKHFYRPSEPSSEAKFPVIPMVTIAELGGWKAVQKKHFDDGGLFDQLYAQ